jgi:hypothetical protein
LKTKTAEAKKELCDLNKFNFRRSCRKVGGQAEEARAETFTLLNQVYRCGPEEEKSSSCTLSFSEVEQKEISSRGYF